MTAPKQVAEAATDRQERMQNAAIYVEVANCSAAAAEAIVAEARAAAEAVAPFAPEASRR